MKMLLLVCLTVFYATDLAYGDCCQPTSKLSACKRFLVINSYEPSFPITRDQEEGAMRAFEAHKKLDCKWTLESIYLDQKRATPVQLAKNVANAREIMQKNPPAAVLTTDDFALKSFSNDLRKLKIQTVFSGVNGELSDYGLHEGVVGFSGTLEKYNYPSALLLLKRLNPKIKKIVVVSEPDITGQALISEFKKQIETSSRSKNFDLSIEYFVDNKFRKLKEKLSSVNANDTAVCMMAIYTQRDDSGAYVDRKVIDSWIKSNTKFLDLGLSFFQVDDGRLMSLASSMKESGFYSTNILFSALRQKLDVSDFPVRKLLPLRLTLNHDRAKDIGIRFPFDFLTYADNSDNLINSKQDSGRNE